MGLGAVGMGLLWEGGISSERREGGKRKENDLKGGARKKWEAQK